LSHTALEAAATAAISHLAMTAGDRWLLSLNLSHVGGFAILVRCLMCEAAVALADPGMPPEAMVWNIVHARATLASLVPTQLERLLGAEVPSTSVESLRAVLLGGAHAPRRLVQRARDAGWPILTTYGLSEAGSQICTQPLTDLNVGTVADDAGIPLPGVDVRIESGVICMRGAALFDGYLAESASPFDADGWFRTSDLGTMTDQGRLVPLGRCDDCIVTGGEKVSVLEIESTLLELQWIRAAAIAALADPTWGQVIAAAVVLDPSADVVATMARTEAALVARLAPHKRPRRWLALEQLPLLASGKLDRPAVRALFLPNTHPSDVEAVGFCAGSG
jgi:O-succinylbenzoic acid--CoA ligase